MAPSTKLLLVATTLLCIFALACQGPKSDEMPVTTTSREARDLYAQAVQKYENVGFAEARDLFRQAVEKDPEFALAHAMLGSGSSEEALKSRAKALSLIGKVSDGERQYITFVTGWAAGQTQQAMLVLDSLALAYPRDKHLQFTAGAVHWTLKDNTKAIAYLEAAVNLDQAYGPPRNLLGYTNMALGNNEAAEKAFKTYMEVEPAAANPHDSYGEFLLANGRYDESAAEYEKAFAMDSTFTNSLVGAGDAYLRKGDTRKALEKYTLAVARTTSLSEKLNGLWKSAFARIIAGEIPAALTTLEDSKTLALKEKRNAAALNLEWGAWYVASALGKPGEGMKKCDELVKMARTIDLPDSVRASYLKWDKIYKAYTCLEANDVRQARALVASFQKEAGGTMDPEKEFWFKVTQGAISLKEGKLDDAVRTFSALPEEPVTLHALYMALTKKGEKEKAGTVIEKLRKHQPLDLPWAIENRQAATSRGV